MSATNAINDGEAVSRIRSPNRGKINLDTELFESEALSLTRNTIAVEVIDVAFSKLDFTLSSQFINQKKVESSPSVSTLPTCVGQSVAVPADRVLRPGHAFRSNKLYHKRSVAGSV